MVSGMQVEKIAFSVDVNQWNHIRPSIRIHGTYMRDFMCTEELSNFFVGHHSLCAVHAPPQISTLYVCPRRGLLKLSMFFIQSGKSATTQFFF